MPRSVPRSIARTIVLHVVVRSPALHNWQDVCPRLVCFSCLHTRRALPSPMMSSFETLCHTSTTYHCLRRHVCVGSSSRACAIAKGFFKHRTVCVTVVREDANTASERERERCCLRARDSPARRGNRTLQPDGANAGTCWRVVFGTSSWDPLNPISSCWHLQVTL